MSQPSLFFGTYTVLHPTFRFNVFINGREKQKIPLDIADGDSFILQQAKSTDPSGYVVIIYGKEKYLVLISEIQAVIATELIVAELIHLKEDRVPVHMVQ